MGGPCTSSGSETLIRANVGRARTSYLMHQRVFYWLRSVAVQIAQALRLSLNPTLDREQR